MKFKDLLSKLKPIANVAAAFIPGGPAALAAVNIFLPDDKQLDDTATGKDIAKAVAKLPPDQQAELMGRDIDLKIAQEQGWTERHKAMTENDGQSTRPFIALIMAWLLVGEITVFAVIMGYGVFDGGLKALNQPHLWSIFGVLSAIPAGVLGKYFGDLRREQGNRLGAQSGLEKLVTLFRK